MPLLHMRRVSFEIGAGLVEGVVKLQVQVVRLQIGDHQDRRHRARKFAESVVNVLCLQRYAGSKRFIMDLGGAAHPGTFVVSRAPLVPS